MSRYTVNPKNAASFIDTTASRTYAITDISPTPSSVSAAAVAAVTALAVKGLNNEVTLSALPSSPGVSMGMTGSDFPATFTLNGLEFVTDQIDAVDLSGNWRVLPTFQVPIYCVGPSGAHAPYFVIFTAAKAVVAYGFFREHQTPFFASPNYLIALDRVSSFKRSVAPTNSLVLYFVSGNALTITDLTDCIQIEQALEAKKAALIQIEQAREAEKRDSFIKRAAPFEPDSDWVGGAEPIKVVVAQPTQSIKRWPSVCLFEPYEKLPAPVPGTLSFSAEPLRERIQKLAWRHNNDMRKFNRACFSTRSADDVPTPANAKELAASNYYSLKAFVRLLAMNPDVWADDLSRAIAGEPFSSCSTV